MLKLAQKVMWLVVSLLPSAVWAQPSSDTKNVVVLYWYDKDYPWNVKFDRSFQTALRSSTSGSFEYYAEYLETNRFTRENLYPLLRDYLREKYAGRRVDAVVATADASLEFLMKFRSDLFPDVPIVFVATNPPAQAADRTPGMTRIISINAYKKTLDLALKLHRSTIQAFIVSGTLEHDKRIENLARPELQGYEGQLAIDYLTDVEPGELVAKMKSLPKDAIVLYVWQQSQNQHGGVIESMDILDSIAKAATVPIYKLSTSSYPGSGVIGGYINTAEASGDRIAEIVLQIAHGVRPQDIPVESAPTVPEFDWRELQRWRIDENELPAGSAIRFKDVSFWQQYKGRIIGVLTLIAFQALLIAILLIERRQRQRAKKELGRINAELEARVEERTAALAGKTRELEAFAYSVAHDLKAPLRGIEGYSRLLLEDYRDKLDEDGQGFLQTIRSSTDEMGELIEDLLAYSRIDSQEMISKEIELYPLINSLIERKTIELGESRIQFAVNVNGSRVIADIKGLTQVLRNYLDNAVKFTSRVSEPHIEIGSDETEHDCRLWVRDNGIGFDMKYHDKIFEIFTRLHHDEEYPGTGIGLAIVRKAVKRMRGQVWAESSQGCGATFYLEIPRGGPTAVTGVRHTS